MPAQSHEITFLTSTSDYLSFATLYVQSNDLILAPKDAGIARFSLANGLEGDISDRNMLWDALAEVNEFPGVGPNQPMRKSGPNTGPLENGFVRLVDDGYMYFDALQAIQLKLTKM